MKTTKEQLQEILDEKLPYEEAQEKINKVIQSREYDEGCTITHSVEFGGDATGCNGSPQKRNVVEWSHCKDSGDNRTIHGAWGC